jgi:hypothetical protein
MSARPSTWTSGSEALIFGGKISAIYAERFIITLVVNKTAIFYAENCRKSSLVYFG